MEPIKISEWDYISIGEYKGKPQLLVSGKNKEGKLEPKFVKVTNKAQKLVTIPLTITFGGDEELKSFASWLMDEVCTDAIPETESAKSIPDPETESDAPF